MKKLSIFCLILTIGLCARIFAKDVAMPRLEMPTAASNGFGGTHVAYTDNVYSLFVNPAAMIRVNQKSFFTLAPSLVNPQRIFNFIEPVQKLMDNDTSALGTVADNLSDMEGKIALGFELREFPLSIAWVANGFGFGLWDRVSANAIINGDYIEANVLSDVMLPVGFAFKILDMNGHTLDAGVSATPFVRVYTQFHEEILRLADSNYDIEDKLNVPLIAGAGLDLGLMYRWDKGLRAGITFDDIVTRGGVMSNIIGNDSSNYYVPFTMNLGAAYDVKLGQFLPNAPAIVGDLGFTLMADWRDFTNIFQQNDYLNHRNAALDLGLGFQFSMLNEMIKLRLGMSEMLPSFGFGFDLGPVEIDLAYYGKEFGYEPGMLSAAVVELSVGIRPGAKERSWPWARRAIFTASDTEN